MWDKASILCSAYYSSDSTHMKDKQASLLTELVTDSGFSNTASSTRGMFFYVQGIFALSLLIQESIDTDLLRQFVANEQLNNAPA